LASVRFTDAEKKQDDTIDNTDGEKKEDKPKKGIFDRIFGSEGEQASASQPK
jgi:hypothetical protein